MVEVLATDHEIADMLVCSQSLDMAFKPHGVHVTALCPGFTHSECHDVMGTRDTANHLPSILWPQTDWPKTGSNSK